MMKSLNRSLLKGKIKIICKPHPIMTEIKNLSNAASNMPSSSNAFLAMMLFAKADLLHHEFKRSADKALTMYKKTSLCQTNLINTFTTSNKSVLHPMRGNKWWANSPAYLFFSLSYNSN